MPRLALFFSFALFALVRGQLPVDSAEAADIVFDGPRVKAVLGDDGVWKSLALKPSGRELLAAGKRLPLAEVVIGQKHYAANRAAMDGARLTVGFAGCDTQLVYGVDAAGDWIAWKLVEVKGARPARATLVRIGVTIAERVGTRLGGAWDERDAVCLVGTNRQTEARPARRAGFTELAACSQDAPGPKLEGAGCALVAAPTPELRGVLRKLSVAFDLVRNEQDGVPSKDLPLARQSYWFLGFGEKDADRVIDLCRQTGFTQVLLNSGSWCVSPGHYVVNTHAYPDGVASLRRTVERFHEHGILLSIHAFASKVSKRDPYVTPVPDRRFWVDLRATLAADVDAGAAAIRTRDDLSQWPGSPACRQKIWEGGVRKHQEVILDDEIVQYDSIGPEGRWDTFLGCKRGAWGTKAAAHKAGAECRHYGVDGCIDGYILDQDAALFDETTSRLAALFDACGFDGVYFDGSEDVDRRRYDYYAANAHAAVVSKIKKRPIVHMGGGFHHNVWHSFTHSGTVDTYLNTLYGYIGAGGTIDKWPTVRDHINGSVRYVESLQDDMIPGELGWFGIWPKGPHTDGLQLDETEYLMGKSLALDAPISLQTSFGQMESHPLTPGILEIVGAYERLRRSGKTPAAVKERLRAQDKDFMFFHAAPAREDSLPEFLAVQPAEVAGGKEVRAMVGACGEGSVAAVWHYVGREGTLVLDTERVTAADLMGRPIEVRRSEGQTRVPIGPWRTTLVLAGAAPQAARELLAKARVEIAKP